MRLSWLGDDRLAGSKLLLLAANVEKTPPAKYEIDLIRFVVAVNPLILSGLQAVQVTEVFGRIEQRHLLHFVVGKPNQIVDVLGLHTRVKIGVRRVVSYFLVKKIGNNPSDPDFPGYCSGNTLALGIISSTCLTRCG